MQLECVTEDGADAAEISSAHLSAVADELLVRLDTLDGLLVVISGDLEATAARRSGERPTDAHRSLSQLGAKVVRDADGDALLIAAEDLAPSADLGNLRFTIAHEAHHVVIARAQESTHDIRFRKGRRDAAGDWLALAGICAEEHRVDRALQTEFRRSPNWPAQFPGILARAQPALDRGTRLVAEGDATNASSTILGTFRQLVVAVAYVAAADLGAGDPLDIDDHALREKMVGPCYAPLRDAFAHTPPANERRPQGELDAAAERLVEPLQGWLAHLGFVYFDTLDGPWFGLV